MTVSRLGDRLLALFVRRGDAGACVPQHGDTCWRSRTICGGHVLYEQTFRGTTGCHGNCGNQQLVSSTPVGKC